MTNLRNEEADKIELIPIDQTRTNSNSQLKKLVNLAQKYPILQQENTNSLNFSNQYLKTMSSRLRPKERLEETTQFAQFIYIDYLLMKDDTLLSLSMKFGVSISDLKRLNVLQNDRDIYALKTLKIPIKQNSIHSERYAGQLKYSDTSVTRLNSNDRFDFEIENEAKSDDESANSQTSDFIEIKSIGNMDEYSATAPLLSDPVEHNKPVDNKQAKEAKKFFKKLDSNLETLKTQNDELLNTVTQGNHPSLIPISNISYSVESRFNKTSNGTRDGSGYFNLNVRDTLIIACFIIILFPVVLFVYEFFYANNNSGNLNNLNHANHVNHIHHPHHQQSPLSAKKPLNY